MQRPSRKQCWVWAVSVLVLVVLLGSLPPVRVQYHQWRLENVKARKARLLAADPSALDRFRLRVTGTPVSGQQLDAAITYHEGVLVRLGFLDRENLPAQMISTCAETLESLDALKAECPWYHAETIASTNLLITACPKMMERWRKRAQKLGW